MKAILHKWSLCAAVFLLFGLSRTQAGVVVQLQDLLVVDLSVVNQVTVYATPGLSAATTSGSDAEGVYFQNFYGVSGTSLSAIFISGNLTNAENPSNFSPGLFRFSSDPGLNLFVWSTDDPVSFTAGQLAFTGSATWSLSPTEYAEMVAGNKSGDLYFPADQESDLGDETVQILGTYYVVVPEPGSVSLLAVALGLGAFRRRRR